MSKTEHGQKMQLGPATGWAPWAPQKPRVWPLEWHDLGGRYWPKPFGRFFERLGYRRYSSGPMPWKPGRYQTSAWQPYTGYGKFSGLREVHQHKYFAQRYTGVRLDPDDYRHHTAGPVTPEEIARKAAYRVERYRRRSWRFF